HSNLGRMVLPVTLGLEPWLYTPPRRAKVSGVSAFLLLLRMGSLHTLRLPALYPRLQFFHLPGGDSSADAEGFRKLPALCHLVKLRPPDARNMQHNREPHESSGR